MKANTYIMSDMNILFENPATFKILKKNERLFKKTMIINATRSILKNKKWNNIGMKEIAEEVGIAPSSLYSYFRCQEELFFEVFLIDLNNIGNLLSKDFDKTRTISKSLAINNIESTVKYLNNNESTYQLFGFLLAEHQNIHDLFSTQINNIKVILNDCIIKILKAIGMNKPTEFKSEAFIAALFGSISLFGNRPDLINLFITMFGSKDPMPEHNGSETYPKLGEVV